MEATYDYREKKIVAVLNRGLPVGLAMNALGHMAFSAGHYADKIWMGKEILQDKDSIAHQGLSRYPVIVLQGNAAQIKAVIKEAKEQNIPLVDFTQEMFDTATDDELVEEMLKKGSDEFSYHGLLLYTDTATTKKLTGKFGLYR